MHGSVNVPEQSFPSANHRTCKGPGPCPSGPPPVPHATLGTATHSGILVAECTRLLLGLWASVLGWGPRMERNYKASRKSDCPVGDIVVSP